MMALPLSLGWSGGAHADARPPEDASFCRDHVRVKTKKLAAQMLTNERSYPAGEKAVFRVDNTGGVAFGLIGEAFVLERFDAGRWSRDPATPALFTRVRLGELASGRSGFCREFEIPTTQANGRYRFKKTVSRDGRLMNLFAPFRVRAAT